jgi:integrase
VFRKADGRGWGSIRTAFERACREAKLDDFRFHDLRHTCASWLVLGGRSLKEVQEILGHREFTMTLRYAHLSPDRLRDAVASLERFSARKAHGATLEPSSAAAAPQDSGNVDAPVAQLDRATVS